MAENNDAIVTHDLTKVYTDFWLRPKVHALSHLNLSIRRGEVFGLLGPNGSGKTTTIKLLLGLIFPTSGRAEVFGATPGSGRVNERIGYLPEESYLHRFLNAIETLDFYGRLFRLPRDVRKRRCSELLDMLGLDRKARRRPLKEYSKGMSRRIGMAQALINDPDLILLDEPTVGLDPIGTREIKDLIKKLRNQGKTILLSSHLLADVQDVCDRIGILANGRLRELGSVKDLLTVQDIVRIEARNVSSEVAERLKSVIADNGGELINMDHPTTTLEDLFLRVVTGQSQPKGKAGKPHSS
ncbi:MAG: ABC transporter ATP-binding protein [Phycisphaerae bacterium]|nr:ABC transporter ATP-binding protein [Phycisphaerae bacterium]